MYAPFFGLRQEPFSIAPDPRFLFMSERHREALAHLLYGLGGGGGFVLLSGEIGAGKTTVCRCFLEQIPQDCNVAYIFNPKLSVCELLKSICDEFHVAYSHDGPGAATVKDYIDPLNEFLLRAHAAGRNNVLVIDEAQSLSADVLEQLRLLTNLETNERKLLQIILIGQPELRALLARPELEQLAQRVIARFHLGALSEDECAQYIRHRLAVAGMEGAIPFNREALKAVHRFSRGVPRRINLLCDRALLGAYAEGTARVGRAILDKAAREVFGGDKAAQKLPAPRYARFAWAGLGLAAGVALAGVVGASRDDGIRLRAAGEPVDARVATATAREASTPLAATLADERSARARPVASGVAAAADTASHLRDEKQAWRELAKAWGVALDDAQADPCEAAQKQQLQCWRGTATLKLIRQLDRPGILTLRGADARPAYALLTGLSDRAATLRVADATQTLSHAALARIWRGEYATFWRTQDGLADDGEAASDWLAARLASLDEAPAASTGTPLRTRVQAFQVAQGLKADGVAGPMTLMQLNRAMGVAEPRLQSSR